MSRCPFFPTRSEDSRQCRQAPARHCVDLDRRTLTVTRRAGRRPSTADTTEREEPVGGLTPRASGLSLKLRNRDTAVLVKEPATDQRTDWRARNRRTRSRPLTSDKGAKTVSSANAAGTTAHPRATRRIHTQTLHPSRKCIHNGPRT